MLFTDALELGKPRRTKEGYLAVRAKAARTGVYRYTGRDVDPNNEHGLRDEASVNVLRDEGTVFDTKAVQSFIGKPITVDHPHEAVTSANWKDHGKGVIMGALRDGDYLAFDLLLMDEAAIGAVDAGKKELSNGYAAELEFGDFTAPDGTSCPVRQSRITDGNHVALVGAGRAGSECRITDGGKPLFETCDSAPVILIADAGQENTMKDYLTLDGLKVDLSDADAVKAAVAKLQDAVKAADTAKETAEGQVAALTTDKATLEAKVTTLEQQLADAKVTPQQLRDAAASFAKVVEQGKALGITVTDGMDEPAIRKAAVTAKLGEKANGWTDEQIETSFATLTAGLADADDKPQPFTAPRVVANDRQAVDSRRRAWLADKSSAYRRDTAA